MRFGRYILVSIDSVDYDLVNNAVDLGDLPLLIASQTLSGGWSTLQETNFVGPAK